MQMVNATLYVGELPGRGLVTLLCNRDSNRALARHHIPPPVPLVRLPLPRHVQQYYL